jgi:hypothetical protein
MEGKKRGGRGRCWVGKEVGKRRKESHKENPQKKEQPKIDLVYTLELALLHHKHKPLHSSRRPLLPYLGWVTFPQILFTFFLLHSSGAIAVGGDRGDQAPAVRTQEKRETEKKRERERERERAWQVVHTRY